MSDTYLGYRSRCIKCEKLLLLGMMGDYCLDCKEIVGETREWRCGSCKKITKSLVCSCWQQESVDKRVEKYGPSILEEAQGLVHGVRQENYDHPYDNHKRIAGFLSVYLADILKRDITPREAAMCILLVKIAREMFKSKRDNGVDICGYAAVIEMIDQKEEEIKGESSGSWHRS